MTSLMLALALVGGTVVSPATPRVEAPHVLLHYPATTPGARFEVTPSTVFSWEADAWNMVRFPETLSNTSAWTAVGVTVAADVTAPTPLALPGWKVTSTSAASSRLYSVGNVPTTTGTLFTRSILVKQGTVPYLCFINAGWTAQVSFDLSGAAPAVLANGNGTITAAGSGWYRLSATIAAGGAADQFSIVLGGNTNCSVGAPVGTYAHLQHAQMVRGNAARPYRSPPAANLLASPSAFDNATAWTPTAAWASAPVLTANADRAPDGTFTADRIVFGAVPGVDFQSHVGQSFTAVSTTTYTGSVWLRADAPTMIYAWFVAAGVSPRQVTCNVTTDWTQCALPTQTLTAAQWFFRFGFDRRESLGYTQAATTTPTTVYAWNATLTRADQNGDTLVMAGTVPWSPTSVLFPAGAGTGRRRVGPFTDANYIQPFGATTSDPLDSTGDRWGIVAFVPPAIGTFAALFQNGLNSTSGYLVDVSATGAVQFRSYNPTQAFVDASGLVVPNALNVACWWRTGTTIFVRANNASTMSAAGGTEVSGVGYAMKVGRGEPAGQSYGGTIVEMVQGLGAPTGYPSPEAWCIDQTAKALANGNPATNLFDPVPNEVLHVSGNAYDGTTWRSPAVSMTTVGTVPHSDAFVPLAVPGVLNRGGYGTFSDTNYLSLGSGNDVLDFTGDFAGCVAYTPSSLATNGGLVSTGNASNGWDARYFASSPSALYFVRRDTVQAVATPAANGVAGGINIGCFGVNGTNVVAKQNLGAVATGAITGTAQPGTGQVAMLGKWPGGGQPTVGTIHGAWFASEPATDALFTKIQQRALGHLTADGTPISLTRTTTETYEVPAPSGQTLWTAPPGVAAIGPHGIGLFRAATNVALQSETSCVANAVQAPWTISGTPTCASENLVGPDGTTTMDYWENSSGSGHYLTQPTSIASSTVYTASAWMRKAATGNASLVIGATATTGCTCGTSDGSACTPSVYATNFCKAVFTAVGTTPIRGWVTATVPNAATSVQYVFNPGDHAVSTGAAWFWGAQIDPGPVPMPYKRTTTTSVAGNADNVTMPLPIQAQDTQWCVSGVWTPYARSWATTEGQINTLWAAGSFNAANSARAETIGSKMIFTVVDSAGSHARLEYNTSAMGTGSRAVKACVADGRQALYVDGTLVEAGALPVAGDWQNVKPAAWSSVPATVTLGARVEQTNHFDGYLRDFKVEDPRLSRDDLAALDARIALAYPANAVGALLERDVNTVFHWSADEWNMVRFPEAFDDTSWAKTATTVQPNTVVAPDGTLTADTVTDTAATSTHYVSRGGIYGAAAPHTGSIFVKAGTLSWFWLSIDGGSTVVYFNASTGTLGSAAGGTAQVTNAGNGWWRLAITKTLAGAATGFYIGLAGGNNAATYAGTGTGTLHFWGAQLVRGAAAPPYKPGQGDTLVMAGTVPLATRSPLYKDGFGTGRRAVGPFTDTDYIQPYATTTSDPLDSTGDRFGIVAFVPSSTGASAVLVSNGIANTAGHYVQQFSTGSFTFGTNTPTVIAAGTANYAIPGALNVGCWWRTGASISVKLNGGLTATNAAAGTEVSGTAYTHRIGRYEGGGQPYLGGVTEVVQGLGAPAGYASPEAWCIDQTEKALTRGDATTALFTPPSNALMHLKGNDYASGPLWPSDYAAATEVGTVPYSDAFIPALDGRRQRVAYGPYSATNNFSGPTSLGEWAGDWSATVVFTPGTLVAQEILVSKRNVPATSGWACGVWTTGEGIARVSDGAEKSVLTAGASGRAVPGAVNVITCGRSGGSIYVRVNGGASGVTAGIGTMTSAAAVALNVGVYGGSLAPATTTTIHEVILSTTPYSDALHEARWRRVTGTLTARGVAVTNTRSTPTTMVIPAPTGQTLWNVPASSSAIGPLGVGAWKQATNSALQSETSCVGNAVQTPWALAGSPTCVSDVGVAPDGTTTMDEWTSVANTDRTYQQVTIASSATFTSSWWASKASGTIHSGITRCVAGTMNACTCGAENGSACTATPGTTDCIFKFTGTTTVPSRYWVASTCAAALTTPHIQLNAGDYGVATGTTRFWGVQVEPGLYPTPYKKTTTGSVQGNADVITTPLDPTLAYANLVLNSDALNLWSANAGVTINADSAACPTLLGGGAMDKVNITAGGSAYQNVTVPTTAGPFTYAAVVASPTGINAPTTMNLSCGGGNATSCSCVREDGVACTATAAGSSCSTSFTAPAAPVRTAVTTSCAGVQTSIYPAVTFSGTVGSTCAARNQVTLSSAALPYVPTTSTIAYSDQKWCVDGNVTTTWTPAIRVAEYYVPFALGDAGGSANSGGAYFYDTTLYIKFRGGDNVLRESGAVHGLTGYGTTRVTLCQNNGVQTAWINGVVRHTTSSGGTGMWTATPASAYIGGQVGGMQIGGSVQGFRVVKGATSPADVDATP